MRKILILAFLFFICAWNVNAQLMVCPKLSLNHSGVNVGDSSASGRFSLNPEVLVKYCFTDKWAAGIGTGYRRAKTSDFGTMSAVPLYASILYGEYYGLDFNFGYMIPINSTSTPLLSGPFTRVGAFIRTYIDDENELIGGAYLDVFNVTGTKKVPTYVPDGYGPIVSGVGFGLYLQYAFSVGR